MKVSAQYAQEHFTDIARAAFSGEPVEIEAPGKPTLVLAARPAVTQGTPSGRSRRELWGAGEGLITLPGDAEWKEMDNEFADQMLSRPISPDDGP